MPEAKTDKPVSNKPRVLRGGFVDYESEERVIFQFNPEQLTRNRSVDQSLLNIRKKRKRKHKNLRQMRDEELLQPVEETMSFDMRLDAGSLPDPPATKVPEGETVLTEAQTFALGEALAAIHVHFYESYGPAPGGTGWYGMDVEFRGPTYRSMKVDGKKIRVSFDHADGLEALGGQPTHFTIAGADRKFFPAVAKIDRETIVVSSEEVPEPVAVRFAWGAADEPNLQNASGLPAPPFRTDQWPGVTARR